MSHEKDHSFKVSLNVYRRLLNLLLQEEKEDLWILIIYGVCVSVCSLVIPVAVQTFVNTIGFGLLLQPILILTLIVFAILVFSGVMRALQTYATEILQQRLFVKVAMALAFRIPRVELTYFSHPEKVYKSNYFLEIATLQKTATILILDASAVVLQVLLGIVLLAFYHPFLLGLNFLILLFIAVFIFGLARPAIESSIEESKAKYSVGSWLNEMARSPLHFKTAQGRKFALDRADQLTVNYVLKRRKHFRVLFRQSVAAIVLQIFISSLLLGVGGWLVVKGQLTLGQLVASEIIVSSVVLGIGKFGKYLETFYDLAASLDKLGHLFTLPVERSDGEEIQEPSREAQLFREKVGLPPSFSETLLAIKDFQLSDKTTQMPVSFQIRSNEKLAITGSNPVLRSNLMKSICGLMEGYTGTVELSGIDLKYRALENVRSKTAYVCDTDLITGTLLENLRFGNESIALSEVLRVLKALEINEIFTRLPDGLNCRVDDEVIRSNRSLIRTILLARAVLTKPAAVVLDLNISRDELLHDKLLQAFLKNNSHSFAIIFHISGNHDEIPFANRVIDLDKLEAIHAGA